MNSGFFHSNSMGVIMNARKNELFEYASKSIWIFILFSENCIIEIMILIFFFYAVKCRFSFIIRLPYKKYSGLNIQRLKWPRINFPLDLCRAKTDKQYITCICISFKILYYSEVVLNKQYEWHYDIIYDKSNLFASNWTMHIWIYKYLCYS